MATEHRRSRAPLRGIPLGGPRPASGAELLASAPAWHKDASCRTLRLKPGEPDPFFPSKGEGTAKAKQICRWCPVKDACAQWAADNRVKVGVWGGVNREQVPKNAADSGPRARAKRNIAAGEKQCSRCQVTKKFASYSKSSSSLDGHVGVCKACRSDQDARIRGRRAELRAARKPASGANDRPTDVAA